MGTNKQRSRFIDWVNGDTPEKIHEYSYVKKTIPSHTEQAHEEVITPKKARLFDIGYRITAVAVCLVVVSVLLYTVFNLPLFGSPNNPASNEVVERYVEKGLEETGAVNAVAGMILDYRAFDTFGESSVLFIAVGCVMMLLLRDKNNISAEEDALAEKERIIEKEVKDPILQKIVLVVTPCIFMFGIYVVLNGHLSPGGGFSGGAIMGAGLILFAASFGTNSVQRIFNMKTFRGITTIALMCYALSKAYSFFTGANGLETGIPLGIPGAILSSGLILVLDICVGLIVACTMYGFYSLFVRGEI
ncbi:MAG: hypothetical protein IJO48_03790 [Clostridia bacterium]|nr:hypothetical protein [Clostridia bacterium]